MLIAVGGEDIHLGTGYEAPIKAGVRRVGIGKSRYDLHSEVLEGAGMWERQAVSMRGERDLRVVFGHEVLRRCRLRYPLSHFRRKERGF